MGKSLLLILIFISSLGYSNTCQNYFSRAVQNQAVQKKSQQLKSLLQMEQERNRLSVGEAHATPYLELSPTARLTYYNLSPSPLFPSLSEKPRLRLEEYIEDIGWVPRADVPIDSKTGVIDANEGLGKAILRLVVQQASQGSSVQSGLFFVDINNLKMINSTRRAHEAGDEYIVRLIEIAKSNLRMQEGRDSLDIGFKVGGDEFIFVLRDVKSLYQLNQIADRIESVIRSDSVLLELFDEPRYEFLRLLKSLKGVRSYRELSSKPELLSFFETTKMWAELPEQVKLKTRLFPSIFVEMVEAFVQSSEVGIRLQLFDAIQPGASIGRKLIKEGDTYEQVYRSSDRQMTRRKLKRKQEDQAHLPEGIVVTPDVYIFPRTR